MAIAFVPLTKGQLAIVDEEDYDLVCEYSWQASYSRGKWYARAAVRGVRPRQFVSMHRLILGVTGTQRSDHRNGDGLDNTRSNLRCATPMQNSRNVRKRRGHTSSRYKGVVCRRGRWEARIRVNRALVHLGMHATQKDAARAYDAAAAHHFGAFACLNFASEE